MRYKLFSLFFFLVLFSCKKTNNEPDRFLVDLSIINTTTSKSVVLGQEIISQVKCIKPNTCYEFSNLVIREINSRQFEIRAKGTIPNGNKGDLVLDPFSGSGTECVSSQNLNRKFIGIEKNEIYFEIAEKRLNLC